MMSKIDNFPLLLSLRSQYKRLSQLSWTISQLEKRYPVELLDQDTTELLIKEYLALRLDIEEISSEIEKLRRNYGTGN